MGVFGVGGVPVGDDGDAAADQLLHRLRLHTAPAQLDPGPGIGQLHPQGEGVDARRHPHDGVVGHKADHILLGHGACHSAGDKLGFIQAAVVHPHAGVGQGQGAVEHLYIAVLGSDAAAGADHAGGGGEDQLCPLLHCLLHGGVIVLILRLVHLDAHLVAQLLLQVLPPVVVSPGPGAGFGVEAIDESDLDMFGMSHVQQFGENVLTLFLRLGDNGDGLLPLGFDVRPDDLQLLCQLRQGQLLDIAEAEHLQPGQQRFRRGDVRLFRVYLLKGLAEVAVPGGEAALLPLVPDVVLIQAQRRLQAGVLPPLPQNDAIQARQGVKLHELVIDLHGRIAAVLRHQPGDIGGNDRVAVAFQHADPLVALLHIETAHVLKAADRVGDALVTEMGVAQQHPLGGKFTVLPQQRHEVPGQGGGAAGAFCPGHQGKGDVDDAQLHPGGHAALVHDLVQHRQIRIAAGADGVFIVSLSGLQGLVILFQRFRAHDVPPARRFLRAAEMPKFSFPASV